VRKSRSANASCRLLICLEKASSEKWRFKLELAAAFKLEWGALKLEWATLKLELAAEWEALKFERALKLERATLKLEWGKSACAN
jgi:hypothetical protein